LVREPGLPSRLFDQNAFALSGLLTLSVVQKKGIRFANIGIWQSLYAKYAPANQRFLILIGWIH
jgi:hypothetical protein